MPCYGRGRARRIRRRRPATSSQRGTPVITYGVLSTYPPTQCGLATFSAALLRHLNRPGARRVAAGVRVASREPLRPPPLEGVADLRAGDPRAAAAAAAGPDPDDAAVVQPAEG